MLLGFNFHKFRIISHHCVYDRFFVLCRSLSLSPPPSSPKPSFVPSAAPTSYRPTSSPSGTSSEKPSLSPSLMPSESPSLIPSVSPTQYAVVASSSPAWSSSIDEVSIENLDVTYSFDILFLPSNQAQVEEFIKVRHLLWTSFRNNLNSLLEILQTQPHIINLCF